MAGDAENMITLTTTEQDMSDPNLSGAATVTCPFTAAFVSSHPEYADVLDKAHPGWHTAGHERGH